MSGGAPHKAKYFRYGFHRWFGFGDDSRDDPVHIEQRALSEYADVNLHSMIDALNTIVGERLWQVGGQFEAFGEFAITLPQTGLGVEL